MTDTAIDMTAAREAAIPTHSNKLGETAKQRKPYSVEAPARGRAILALANASAESSLTLVGPRQRD